MSINNDRCDNLQRTPEYVESRGAECMLPTRPRVRGSLPATIIQRLASQPANAEVGPRALIRSARAAWNLSCRLRADV